MQVNRPAWLLKGLWPDQATSANTQFHHKPVRAAMHPVVVGNSHNSLLSLEKSLNQFSISNGVRDDDTTIVTTDHAPLRFAANDFPRSPATPPSTHWHRFYRDQHSSASYSEPFKSSSAGSKQWDSQGARPKNKYPAIPNPAHFNSAHHNSDSGKGLNLTGISPWFIARHTQDDYFKNPEKVAADLNNRFVHMKSCMTEPFTGYNPRPPYRSLNNTGLNRVDPPLRHVQAGSDYRGLPLETPQPGNPQDSASTEQQRAGATANSSTGVDRALLPACSGSGQLCYSRWPEEVAKKSVIDITGPAMPGQPGAEPASEQSENSSDVSLTSTASFHTTTNESDTDESLTEPKPQVTALMELEAVCDDIKDVVTKRQEHKKFLARLKKKEDEIRADRKRIRQAREQTESVHAKSWPTHQEAITTASLWLCQHYQRRCRVKFDCCDVFYACHRCHNDSGECSIDKRSASEATHYKCSMCNHEGEIDENSQRCSNCRSSMSAYYCSVCKHFTSRESDPYHCEKCGICRIHKNKSFHCDVCNICLDKRLKNKHKCRPDSGHERCGICLEDAFSGCQVLPCSHKVHRECAVAMIQNNVTSCPVCRHPLYSPLPD